MNKQIQSFISIQCKLIQSFTAANILNLIPKATLNKIKETNEHPYFQAYSICHEGVSTPKVLGDTEVKPIHWTKAAIQSLKNIIAKGIKFFKGHNEDSSTENREALGEIVADTQMEIDGNLHHVVVGYFPDKEKVKDLDICSQEANWSLFESTKNYVADKIEKLTGIALGNSSEELPAFRGAKRLAIMQAFEDNDSKGADSTNKKKGVHDMDLSTIHINELVGELKNRQLRPGQVFSIEEIKEDTKYRDFFKEIEKTKETLQAKEEAIKQLESEKVNLGKQIQVSTASTRLKKLLVNPEKPLTENQVKYIELDFNKKLKNDKLNDVTDEGLKAYIDNKLDDFQTVAEAGLFKDANSNTSLDSVGNNTQVDDENDITKASVNPYLKEDFDDAD